MEKSLEQFNALSFYVSCVRGGDNCHTTSQFTAIKARGSILT